MELAGIPEVLKGVTILDASLYGIAFVLAVLLRFLRAAWLHADDSLTIFAAMLMGVLGAALVMTAEPPGVSHRPWQAIAIQSVSLSVAVLIAERILRALADSGKVPWLPRDNAFVKAPEKAPDTETEKPA